MCPAPAARTTFVSHPKKIVLRHSLFDEIGDSNDKWSSSLEVQCWNEDETHAAPQSPTQI
jgi:hypothetical protein